MVCQFDTDQCLVQRQLCPRDIDVGLIILQSAFCTDLCFLCPVAVNLIRPLGDLCKDRDPVTLRFP